MIKIHGKLRYLEILKMVVDIQNRVILGLGEEPNLISKVTRVRKFGLPIIASDKGFLSILIKNRENGLIIKFPNVKELSEKIMLIFGENGPRDKTKKNESGFVERFEYYNVTKKFEGLHEEIVGG